MTTHHPAPGRAVRLIMAALLMTAGCGKGTDTSTATPAPAAGQAPIVQPGAPGQESRVLPAGTGTGRAPAHTAADIAFMQGMIGHHAQAIEMVELLKTRTARDDMKMLAMRIEVSQNDEIKLMKAWLEERKAPIPNEHAHHMGGPLMPGMLSAGQMAELKAATGAAFDRLFLEGMIRHHEGALTMVEQLLASPGAGQEAAIFDFASHVDSDQRMEISRMRGMLKDKE